MKPKYGKDHPPPPSCWRRGIFGRVQTWILLAVMVFVMYKLIHKSASLQQIQEDELEDVEMVDMENRIIVEGTAAAPGDNVRRIICNPRQMLCERRRDTLFDGLHKADAQELIHRVMTKMDYNCKSTKRFGSSDSAYEVCLDKSFVPKKGDCLIYSFGVQTDFSFEDAINDDFNCEVHSFDASSGKGEIKHRTNMTFHNLGLWGDDFEEESTGFKYRRLANIIDMLGHQHRVIDVLKIDADGAEWPMLRDIALDPSPLENVKQLIFEAHAPRRKPKNQTMKMTDYAQVFRSVSMLKRLGFRNYFHHDEERSASCCKWWADLVPATVSKGTQTICCYEVFLINVNFL